MNITPFFSEWLRAMIMPVAGLMMLYVGTRTSPLSDRFRTGLAVSTVFMTIVAGAAHYQPFRPFLGPVAERLGGEGAVGGYALLLLVGIGRTKVRSAMLHIGSGFAFAFILVLAFFPLYLHYFGHSMYTNFVDADGYLHQTTGFTCAPASATMLLNTYGIRVSEGLLAERAGTNMVMGTNEFSLARALESAAGEHGLKARAAHLTYDEAQDLHRPFVAYIVLPHIGGHAILVTSITSDAVTVSDPLSGASEKLTVPEFQSEWQGIAIWMSERK